MKTLVSQGYSLYIFQDDKPVNITSESVIVSEPDGNIITDCDSSNSIMYENVTVPDGWIGRKYFYDGTNWAVDPDFVEPNAE
jgi:hypothetical protein